MTIQQRNNVLVRGQGQQPLIFAHGFGCDQAMWRLVSPAFEQDYKVVLFDYVGVGQSDPNAYDPERYSSLNGYAQDIVDICEELDLHNAILVGHSVSSMICLLATIDMPERVDRLVMICPSPRYLNDPPDYRGGFERADIEGLLDMIERNQTGWANYLAGMLMQNSDQPTLTEELEASFCAMDPAISRRFANATFRSDNRQDLAKLHKPVLLLQGAQDFIVPTEVASYLHRNLPGSTLKQMKATGHCPHMSHPKETIALIQDYLKTTP
jgi:sigma-B regulation protein RsbQ